MRGSSLLLVALVLCAFAVATEASYWETEMARVRKYAAENYITRTAALPNMTTLPSGVLVSIVKRGHGDVAPAKNDVCEMHYTGTFRFHAVFFDSRTNPYPLRRKPAQLLKPLQDVMEMMREGDRWQVYVPYTLAYGEEGNGADIPSFANLIFDIELYKCPGASGKTSAEIDPFLAKYLKVPMPPKSRQIHYDEL